MMNTFWVAIAYTIPEEKSKVRIISEPANGVDDVDAKLAVLDRYCISEKCVCAFIVIPLHMVLQSLASYTTGINKSNSDSDNIQVALAESTEKQKFIKGYKEAQYLHEVQAHSLRYIAEITQHHTEYYKSGMMTYVRERQIDKKSWFRENLNL